jgi:hypothetical protein
MLVTDPHEAKLTSFCLPGLREQVVNSTAIVSKVCTVISRGRMDPIRCPVHFGLDDLSFAAAA